MSDKEFLQWLYNRLLGVHGEIPYTDYMRKLKSIINATDSKQNTPNLVR